MLKSPLKFGFSAALVTALLSLPMPNYFKSEARILPVDTKGPGSSMSGMAATAAVMGVNVPGAGGEGADANFVDILNSRWLRERLLMTEFQFRVKKWRFGQEQVVKKTLYSYLGVSNMDRALVRLDSMIFVARDAKSKVLFITAESVSPGLSQMIVQRCIRLLEEFVEKKGQTRGGAKAVFAEARYKEAREKMAQAEETFLAFLENNRNYQTSANPAIRVHGARLEAEVKLCQQITTTIAVNREQALMEEKNDIPILNVLDEGNLPFEKSRPMRSVFVLLAFIAFLGGRLAWLHRDWIRARVQEPGTTENRT